MNGKRRKLLTQKSSFTQIEIFLPTACRHFYNISDDAKDNSIFAWTVDILSRCAGCFFLFHDIPALHTYTIIYI